MTRYLTSLAVLMTLVAAAPASATPTADLSINPNPAVRLSPTTFTFTGRCDRSPCTYRWFHGTASSTDEIATNVPQPRTTASFTYSGAPGPRTITLKVRNRRGQEASVTRTFSLVDPSTSPPPPPPPPPPPSGGLPNASNTGIPAGINLTTVTDNPYVISQAGAVISGRDFAGQVVVRAPNVTIRNSRFRVGGTPDFRSWVQLSSESTGLVVEDSEFIGTNVPYCHNHIGFRNFTVRRSEFTGCENAAYIDGGGNVTLVDNYIHDLETVDVHPDHPDTVPHTDGIQFDPGAHDVIVRHNWIDPVGAIVGVGGTSGLIMSPVSSPPVTRVWVEDNYIDGRNSSYAIYAPRHQTTDVFINRNRMRKGYGYTACVRLGITVTQFNGNVDDATGAPLSPDNGFDGGCSN